MRLFLSKEEREILFELRELDIQRLRAEIVEAKKLHNELVVENERIRALISKARVTVADLTRAKNEADRSAEQARSAARNARSGKSW
jgi:septal ring factor EnvC (AmiA/AmiB activator)